MDNTEANGDQSDDKFEDFRNAEVYYVQLILFFVQNSILVDHQGS